MSYYDLQTILNKTNDGLDVIRHYAPDAKVGGKGVKLFVPGQKTGSAHVKKINEQYKITDFADNSIPYGAVDLVMRMEKKDFQAALEFIAKLFNIPGSDGKIKTFKPKIEKNIAPPGLDPSYYKITYHDKIPDAWLREIFAERVYIRNAGGVPVQYLSFDDLRKICDKFFLHAVCKYEFISDGNLLVIHASDDYPVFSFHIQKEGQEACDKLYCPKAEKQYRFRYFGKKPSVYWHGLEQCKRASEELAAMDAGEEEGEDVTKKKKRKLNEAIICSGGSDGLNIAAMGFNVIWGNSESDKVNTDVVTKLSGYSENTYILYDIDKTGREQAHQTNMQFLQLRTVDLPGWITKFTDRRGDKCKDVRDYLKHYNEFYPITKAFERLLIVADPYQFWKQYINPKTSTLTYGVNDAALYRFLEKNGFYRYKSDSRADGYMYIKITGNIVKEVTTVDIKTFINIFLIERACEVDIRNKFLSTTKFNDSSLNNLKLKEIDFTDNTETSQFFFFKNVVWEVTANEVKEYKHGQIDRYVWEKEIIQHDVELLPSFFEAEKIENDWRIKIKNDACLFLKFLRNSSKIHWKVEELGIKENGEIRKELTQAEIIEQEHHLVNKLYSLGFILHRYKDPTKAWAPWVMDAKIADDSESHGGSGKSIAFESPKYFMQMEPINGRDPKLAEDKHVFGNVTEHTDYVLFNDCHKTLDFNVYFDTITGSMTSNAKQVQAIKIPFEASPKIAFTSNYAIREVDPSKLRRVIFSVFCDYYHHGPNEYYPDHRDPKTDLGKTLFKDFTEEEWNWFINTMIQATQLFLRVPEKIDPPMYNVNQRNKRAKIPPAFVEWAEMYFLPENNRFDVFLPKVDLMKDYEAERSFKGITPNKFKGWLKDWCSLYPNYKFNPEEFTTGTPPRILRKSGEKTVEMIYIQTKDVLIDDTNLPF